MTTNDLAVDSVIPSSHHSNNESNTTINNATIARLLGAFFYYAPDHPIAYPLIPALLQIDQLVEWQHPALISEQCHILAKELDNPELSYQFSLLFEGQGAMPAPPWGSVYLDREQLLMGESAECYRRFLLQNGIKLDTGMNEPEDQFGLMLMAFALLLEQGKIKAAKTLIDHHLLIWSNSYLSKLIAYEKSPFYQALGVIANSFLTML